MFLVMMTFLNLKIHLFLFFLPFFFIVPANMADTALTPSGVGVFPSDQVYTDNFEGEKAAGSPSHWIENNRHDYWSIVREAGNNMYRVKRNEVSTYSWLHVFEKNVTFDVRFRVVEIAEADAGDRKSTRLNSSH